MEDSLDRIKIPDLEELNLLRDIINRIPAAIIICKFEENLELIYANDWLFHIIGYSREQFKNECGNNIIALIHEDDLATIREKHGAQLAHGNVISNVDRIVRRDGKKLWLSAEGTIKTLETGELEFFGILNDITAQKEQEDALLISEKRYETAMRFSDVTIFEYNIQTKQMTHHWSDIEKYNMPKRMDNAVESLIASGTIRPSSIAEFREMYRKIDNGASFAQATIDTVDAHGEQCFILISLTTIFDSKHKPVRAIGVKKDVTNTIRLKKEREFGNSFALDKQMTYEANITTNTIISYDKNWLIDIGVDPTNNFETLIDEISSNVIHENYKELFISEMSIPNILKNYTTGKRLSTFEYRKRRSGGDYFWFEKTVNIIKDEITGDIIVRCYIVDINDIKQKQIRLAEEQLFYESMVQKVMSVYEINVTKNTVTSGHENWNNTFGIEKNDNYTNMITSLSTKMIHGDDRIGFDVAFDRQNVIRAFGNGENEIAYEYRRHEVNREYTWVRCSMHLFEDPITNDIRGRAYIENIDHEKRKEIELIYKSEHDPLTSILNKGAVRERINAFLLTGEAKAGVHALFMLDIDHFKSINDNFGHVFGDVVLSKVSTNVKNLFRDHDILGRIGGDEFIILMKNLILRKDALKKAQEICDVVEEIFSKNGISYKISASVGIAFYNEHGTSYDTLYMHADSAMYSSKESGRAMFSVYNAGMGDGFSTPGEIRVNSAYEAKSFNNNIIEYVFRILYESENRQNGIDTVVELLGKHYNVGRVYVLENSDDGESTSNTFEWCSDGVVPQMENRQNMRYDDGFDYKNNFSENGIFYLQNVSDKVHENYRKTPFICEDARSVVQFSYSINGQFKGIIGFDECDYIRFSTKKEFSEIKNVIGVLGIFLVEMRENQKLKNLGLVKNICPTE